MTRDEDLAAIEAYARQIVDQHPCGATIRYDPGKPETIAIHCERDQGHAGCHWNDRAQVIWSAA